MFSFLSSHQPFILATNDQWHTLKQGVPHFTIYFAFFYLLVSCFFIAVILNVVFLTTLCLICPRQHSMHIYLNDWDGRGSALAGFLCGFGNGLEFMSGQGPGYAASASVQVIFFTSLWFVIESNPTLNSILIAPCCFNLGSDSGCFRRFHLWARFGELFCLVSTINRQGKHTCYLLSPCSCLQWLLGS